MPVAAISEIVWYVTGRFYAPQNAKTVADYGYFLHLAGVDDALFADRVVSERSAHLTFAAQPFTPGGATNGALAIGLDPVGEFSIYLQTAPGGNFDVPDSFAQGERVATFRRVGLVVGTTLDSGAPKPTPLLGSNVFSARLVESRPFRLGNGRYDFADLVGSGVTQFGLAASAGIEPPPAGFASVVAFTGSAIRFG